MRSIRILQNLSSAAVFMFPLTWLTHKKVINTLITFHLADLLFVNHGWQSLSCILDNHTLYPGCNIFSYIADQKQAHTSHARMDCDKLTLFLLLQIKTRTLQKNIMYLPLCFATSS